MWPFKEKSFIKITILNPEAKYHPDKETTGVNIKCNTQINNVKADLGASMTLQVFKEIWEGWLEKIPADLNPHNAALQDFYSKIYEAIINGEQELDKRLEKIHGETPTTN